MNTARQSTNTYLFSVFEDLLAQQRRLPVRPQDARDDVYPEFERECSRGEAKNDQDQER